MVLSLVGIARDSAKRTAKTGLVLGLFNVLLFVGMPVLVNIIR